MLLPRLVGTVRAEPGRTRVALGAVRKDQGVNSQEIPPPAGQATLQQAESDSTPPPRKKAGQGELNQAYRIESFDYVPQQAKVMAQNRQNVEASLGFNTTAAEATQQALPPPGVQQSPAAARPPSPAPRLTQSGRPANEALGVPDALSQDRPPPDRYQSSADTVQIRIEPLVPIFLEEPGSGQEPNQLFDGRVFLIRHVRIENRHFLQGFQLDQRCLREEVRQSAERFLRPGMQFTLAPEQAADSTYAAGLDFGFGSIVLNLWEHDSHWIGRQVRQWYTGYFGLAAIVFAAVLLALGALWRNLQAQVRLARKKDDFLSAVSPELRTPLTSIRMYTEMLEKSWVASEAKRCEYYRTMHQETERLSRLIENVLDFSRIQRRRRKYDFRLADLNDCVTRALQTMQPCAAQQGFALESDLGPVDPVCFDHDAVTQIVINLETVAPLHG